MEASQIRHQKGNYFNIYSEPRLVLAQCLYQNWGIANKELVIAFSPHEMVSITSQFNLKDVYVAGNSTFRNHFLFTFAEERNSLYSSCSKVICFHIVHLW